MRRVKQTISNVLFNDTNRLRAPLRLLVVLQVLTGVTTGASYLVVPPTAQLLKILGWNGSAIFEQGAVTALTPARGLVLGVLSLVSYPLAAYFAMKYIDKQNLDEIGVEFSRRSFKEIVSGVFIGTLAGTLIVLPLIFANLATITFRPEEITINIVISFMLLTMASVGIAIKVSLMYAGYLYHILAKITDKYFSKDSTKVIVTVVVASIVYSIFGLARNPSVPALAVFTLYASTVVVLRMITGRISLSFGYIIGFGLSLFSVFGAKSGQEVKAGSLFITEFTGNPLWTGGEYGIQAGAFGILAYILVFILSYDLFLIKNNGKVSPDMDVFSQPDSIPEGTYFSEINQTKYSIANITILIGAALMSIGNGIFLNKISFAVRKVGFPLISIGFPVFLTGLTLYILEEKTKIFLTIFGLIVTVFAVAVGIINYPQNFNTASTKILTRSIVSMYLMGLSFIGIPFTLSIRNLVKKQKK